MKTLVFIRSGAGLAVLALLTWTFVGSRSSGRASEADRDPASTVRRVRVAKVAHTEGHGRFQAHGIARSSDRAVLSFTVPGRLKSRPVRVGERVKTGALLATLDAQAYSHGESVAEAAARKAAAQLAMTERDEARLAQLEQVNAVSREQLDRVASALDAARAARDAAEAQRLEATRALQETQLRAPFAGTVVAVQLEPGEFAGPGSPVVVLSSKAGLETEVEVPGRIAARIEVGDPVNLRMPLDESGPLRGNVSSVGDSAPGPGRLFPVIVAFQPAPEVHARPGSPVEVTFNYETQPALSVPASAVLAPSGKRASVLRIQAGRVERVPVTLGKLYGARVGVEGALRQSDQVITAGYTGLADGEQVEVLP